MAITEVRSAEDVRLDARAWFEAHWDPELTLAQWWDVYRTLLAMPDLDAA